MSRARATEEDVIAQFGIPPRDEDLPAIRSGLEEACELEAEAEADDDSDTLVMKAYCVLLFAAGQVADSLLIWRAKETSFDAKCSIDVQLLCGAGYAVTLQHLRGLDSEEAREALAYIEECDAGGDFAGHDEPGGRLAEILPAYRRYFGLEA